MGFFASGAKSAFAELRPVLYIALILHHFNLECHIQIEINALRYTSGGIFSLLTLDNSAQWHLIAFLPQIITLTET